MFTAAVTASGHWIHDLDPFLVRFTDSIGVRFYGVAYVLAFLGSAWLLKFYSRRGKSPLHGDKVWDLMVALIIGVLVGGRLGSFLLYHPEQLAVDPLALFRVWEGGMASHGGFIGVAVAMYWFARHEKLPFLTLADLVVSTVPLGLFLGRIANFVNGELWGNPSSVPWAVVFPLAGDEALPRHPSQLYEAALEGLVLLAYLQHRLWRNDVVARQPGRLSGEFLIGYAVVRAFCELFREPDASLIFGLSRGTFYSFFLVAAGAALIANSRSLRAKQ
ncbi:MAG: prolipoprotein diacylglyceryl transferase [Opitutaceae bacterium]|nr:prolipoprotein diacylglyceryl transferase [Opitutaceae bacterium]